jgi:RNA polymerase sigma-70 factor (ECF subfamily)
VEAFDLASVVREYESPLLRYVARLIGTRYDEARDVVQDVFLKLHNQVARRGVASIGNLRCWLYRVAHNLAMDYGRSRRRRRELEERALDDPTVLERIAATGPDDTRNCERKESVQLALTAVGNLPEEQRSVVLLKIIQGLTLREISAVTGMKIGTVNYRLTQALRSLANELEGLVAL